MMADSFCIYCKYSYPQLFLKNSDTFFAEKIPNEEYPDILQPAPLGEPILPHLLRRDPLAVVNHGCMGHASY
jgi:hypothetical protein